MNWISKKFAAVRVGLSAKALPERIFWRFVLANFFVTTLAFWLRFSAESGAPISSVIGALLAAGMLWLVPILLFRVRGSSWLRGTVGFVLAIAIISSTSVAAFTTGPEAALAAGRMNPGSGAWIALSALAATLFRGLWQPTEERTTALSRIVNGATAAGLYAVIALWAGTAFHPVFQATLNGALQDLNPARIADAERYLDLAARLLGGIPIQPIVVFLALAVLTVGVRIFGRSFRVGQRVGVTLIYASLVMLGLTSYTYIVAVAAPVSLERLSAQEGRRLASYRDRHSDLILSRAALAYLAANPRAIEDTRDVVADALRGCRAHNDANGIASEVDDRQYRFYNDVIGEDYQWFNLGSETINCNHRGYYSAFIHATRGSLRIGSRLIDSEIAPNRHDVLSEILDSVDQLRWAGVDTRPGKVAELTNRSQKADTALRAAESVIESKLGDLAELIIGEDNANWFKPVLREFVTTLMAESAKEGFASSVRTLTEAEGLGLRLAASNSAHDKGLQAGRRPYRPEKAVDQVAEAARVFAVAAKVTVHRIRIDEGGDWRTARKISNVDEVFLKIACVVRPTSCRHVF